MTLEEFKNEMRLNRGKLTKYDTDLEVIYDSGTTDLVNFALNKKLMGVHNISWIAIQSYGYQIKFTTWMADKNWKASKEELDLWFSQNLGEQ